VNLRQASATASLRWLAVALLGIAWLVPVAGAQEEDPIPLALLPLVVHSSENPDYLRAGLADMLASRLEQAGIFRVIEVEDPIAATTRLRDAIEQGRKAGGRYVLFGSFTRFGQGASLDMQCAETATNPNDVPLREIFVHSGSIGEVIPDLETLVGKVSRFVSSDYERPVADAEEGETSRSPNRSLGDLELRVRDLEAAIERLEADPGPSVDSAPASP